jgi:outer membrane protein assembly factor BamD (BamD/ComL family)
MSVSGISSTNLFALGSQSVQNSRQQLQQEFQQLGQDLQAGNLSGAQADFATLQQSAPQTASTSSTQSSSPLSQAFSQLGTDLQSGNVSAAQQDFANIQRDFQSKAAQGHHHHGGGGGGSSEISQLLAQLNQSLQSGNLSSAQQSYTSLQQQFEQFAQNGSAQAAAPPSFNNFSVNV